MSCTNSHLYFQIGPDVALAGCPHELVPCSWLCSVFAGSGCQAVASVAGTWGSPLMASVCIGPKNLYDKQQLQTQLSSVLSCRLLIPSVSHPHPSHRVGLTVVLCTALLLAFSCSSLLPPLLLWWFRDHSPGGHSV